jgi:hypothetical protein
MHDFSKKLKYNGMSTQVLLLTLSMKILNKLC